MNYYSTRDKSLEVSAPYTIVNGISKEGGLFVPASLPDIRTKLSVFINMGYTELATEILSLFLEDFSKQEIEQMVKATYTSAAFKSSAITPIKRIAPDLYTLELFHGPTLAFKDIALQILPRLLTESLKKTKHEKQALILVATSGDTGKAALEGFAGVAGVKLVTFYPHGGVSDMQYRQMATQTGDNVDVIAVEGNFDDTQTGVKKIFGNKEQNEKVYELGYTFSSANSINWGRLLPQIVYYFSAYKQMIDARAISQGEPINVAVPTGNFGNILAAFYAKQMGLPIKKLICASNKNDVLVDFFNKHTYNAKRKFYKTISPSMDILVSSNLERLLFEATGRDDKRTLELMNQLSSEGKYSITEKEAELLSSFYSGYCNDEKTTKTIKNVWKKYGYLMDTHTAVAQYVYEKYIEATGDYTPAIIVSTASPYKFGKDVLSAIAGEESVKDLNEFEIADKLSQFTGTELPTQITKLKDAPIIHKTVCEKEKMFDEVINWLSK